MKTFKEFLNEDYGSLAGADGDLIRHEGGRIDIHMNPQYAPRKQSVVDFQVPEEKRGQGIGKHLLNKAMETHKDLGAQVSSLASLKVFHNAGFRSPKIPDADFKGHVDKFKEQGGSLFVAKNDHDGDAYVK
jgi:GNAT superfamily N-acetyltransferase